jgi:hypothetical protein
MALRLSSNSSSEKQPTPTLFFAPIPRRRFFVQLNAVEEELTAPEEGAAVDPLQSAVGDRLPGGPIVKGNWEPVDPLPHLSSDATARNLF